MTLDVLHAPNGNIERCGSAKHPAHILDIRNVPVADVFIEMFQVSKEFAHVDDLGNVPLVNLAIPQGQIFCICAPATYGISQVLVGESVKNAEICRHCKEQRNMMKPPAHGQLWEVWLGRMAAKHLRSCPRGSIPMCVLNPLLKTWIS